MRLAQELLGASARLSERVLAEMYQDPFWAARFGERGRTHSRNDGDFHIKYLAEALESEDSSVFGSYARWLRELLVSRGMRSRHLADNFIKLAVAISSEAFAGHERAVAILQAGALALVYEGGEAGEIEALRARLGTSGTSDHARDHLLSYLADAAAYAQPSWFTAYAEFASGLRPTVSEELVSLRALVTSELRSSTDSLETIDAAIIASRHRAAGTPLKAPR